MAPKGKHLTDKQYAAIAWADPRESTAALSRRLGIDRETVRSNRQGLAQAGGWWCELVIRTCAACDLPSLAPANRGGMQRRCHPACQHRRASQQQRDYGRHRTMTRRHSRTLADMRETYQRDLAQTGAYAFRDRVMWTPEEDTRLREMMELPIRELAEELGQ